MYGTQAQLRNPKGTKLSVLPLLILSLYVLFSCLYISIPLFLSFSPMNQMKHSSLLSLFAWHL